MRIKEEPILKVNNVIVDLGANFCLGPINFSINQGDILGILGKNGSGKSTLIYTIANLISNHQGEINIQTDNIGFSFQHPRFYPNKSVLKNLQIFSTIKNTRKSELLEIIRFFELEPYIKQRFKSLSDGNKKRLEIAFSIIGNPDLILLDEPTANIDKTGIELLFDQLNALRGSSTIIMNNHNSHELKDFCTHFLILRDGKQVAFLDRNSFNPSDYNKFE